MPLDQDASRVLFVALLPDDRFCARLQECKDRVFRIAGSQTYLDHPPHLTLYLSVFHHDAPVVPALEELAASLTRPVLEIHGWQVFEADSLTGGSTLVCVMRYPDRVRLRTMQADILAALAPLRDAGGAERHFEPIRDRLPVEQWASVQCYGFPYTGAIWQPHFTVASIRPQDWPRVWEALEPTPPMGPVECHRIALYEIVDSKWQELRCVRL